MYADYEYYTKGYLLGKPPAVPEDDFPYWEKQAGIEIDARTFNRLKADGSLVTDAVRDCTCAIAELLYKADKISDQNLQEGAAGALVSYSNDGESATFNLKESVYTESGKKREIQNLIYRYLHATGLLYAGGIRYES
ncbi:MAG: hypothetical protein K2H52_14100 [Lachnospiraceae bacterium]|nr:hypothetical protein [Lachnospiraceae bacterium]MDE7285834.1 hypothetical protein [Lachnospiraceae bacterium]